MLNNPSKNQPLTWYTWGMIGIFVFSLCLRFWGLGRFNSLVFDEVYYAKFANNYLTHTKFFNAHPPLSQYIIAVGIWLGDMLPIGHDTANNLTGSWRSTFSYRWFNAIFGSFIPIVVGGIAYHLAKRPSYMVIAAGLMSLDGLFLVDSRYALNNVFLVLFGILGQLWLLMGLSATGWRRAAFGLSSGLFFGLSIACKWNGLWFLLGIWLLLGVIVVHQILTRRPTTAIQDFPQDTEPSILVKLSRLQVWEILIYLLVVPAVVYLVSWVPHLQQNPLPNLWEMQSQILHYHEKIKNGKAVHPYCANWYTWPLMLRPLAYYYQVVKTGNSSSLDQIYDVHAMGNPFLWWFAFGAIISMTCQLFNRLITGMSWELNRPEVGLPIFFLANYGANLFPWIRVTRCVYIYHYMGSLVFAVLALAWLIDRWLDSASPELRGRAITAIFVVAAAFVWWLPVYLGLPLSPQELAGRMWFNENTWKAIGEIWNWI
jgi:dolichyl-phosphate-mannose-protein mannosyltransferase